MSSTAPQGAPLGRGRDTGSVQTGSEIRDEENQKRSRTRLAQLGSSRDTLSPQTNAWHSPRTLWVLVVTALACCTPPDQDAVTQSPTLALSSIRYQNVIGNRLLVGLSDRRLDGADLATTVQGRLALVLVVSCALPLGHSLVVGDVEFLGEIGVAPAWAHRGIGRRASQRVTGCILARLSGNGAPIPISMRGPHLPADDLERQEWPLEEGAFAGDLFEAQQVAATCRGRGQIAAPDDPAFENRLCTLPIPGLPVTMCALRFLGDCDQVCRRRRGRYDDCHVGDRVFSQVTTTFLIP